MANELKPCPFCGNSNPQAQSNGMGDWFVICRSDDYSDKFCEAKTSDRNCESKEQAITAWNTRPAAPVEGLSAEQERLRFEGELDKWMKTIGAGITGYQPEAYALMDLACEELVKLRADNAALTARVEELEQERYELAYAITGGEDAPGYLDSLTVETLVEVSRDNTRRWFAETDRAKALESQLAAALGGKSNG